MEEERIVAIRIIKMENKEEIILDVKLSKYTINILSIQMFIRSNVLTKNM